jgi:quinol monooxygenase YgiN
MSITVVLDMTIKAEKLDQFLEHFNQNLPGSRDFDGCEYVNVYQAADNPNRIVCIEGWSSPDRFAAYGAWRREAGDAEAFLQYYDGAPSLVTLTERDM